MSFYGKKYRRVGHDNVQELLAAAKDNEQLAAIIRSKPPTICFTKLDAHRIHVHLATDCQTNEYDFVLGQQKEIKKNDGSIIKVIFTEYSENILDQYILMPNGRSAFFRRVFGERDCKLIISMPETSITATIYFEVIE
ncbi:uncharacterized protein LOC121732239 [Aricia agestis]|uniref:uncharacterized protein LOC121732239 n=1 Tax=Aricia agestis TaxID=91739 RepID=UPI001C2031C9|nr:uncharacterized protein LOC121732239 [Aricia agestis]